MKRILTIVIVVTALLLHSCGGVKKVTPPPAKTTAPTKTDVAPVKDEFVPFTKDIYDKLVANKIDLKAVQYYNDQDIYLARGTDVNAISLDKGKIVEAAGTNVDKIVIAKYTPGKCELVEGDGLRISFQAGSSTFKFLNSKTYSPDNFIFSGANWKDGQCDVDYNGTRYRASCGGGCISVADVKLAVKKSFLDKNNINEKKLPGNTIN
ncbi:hypothetical protein ACFOW1_08160 [Parasediminibacterium paludis]|uniref:Lipoprotein n=1 Tax=Parasediminibacterium paludis TaxID=908966 RepID=A0ABV8PWU3_9BACT